MDKVTTNSFRYKKLPFSYKSIILYFYHKMNSYRLFLPLWMVSPIVTKFYRDISWVNLNFDGFVQ